MITLITGIPGSGKTAHVVEMIMQELKKERKIYVLGIPDLVAQHQVPDKSCPSGFRIFACDQAGNPRTWQKGTWLGIDSYIRPEGSDDELSDDDLDSDFGTSAWKPNGNGCPDKGALVIIDECQTYFRPRSSSSKVPDFIAAFEVHRHQGLDFWLLTQRPQLVDGNLRGLVSRHIHIHTSSMGKKRLEWAECQDPNNKQARTIANRSAYKPNPQVFDLYKSAQVHTKTKIRLPNGVYYLAILFCFMCLAITGVYFKFKSQLVPDVVASVPPSSSSFPSYGVPVHNYPSSTYVNSGSSLPSPDPELRATRARQDQVKVKPAFVSEILPDSARSGCFATVNVCVCHDLSGKDLGYSIDKCLKVSGFDSLPDSGGTLGISTLSHFENFWEFRKREFHRLHPNRRYFDAEKRFNARVFNDVYDLEYN